VIDTFDRNQASVAPLSRGDTASHQGQAYQRPHPHDPSGVEDVQITLLITIVLVVDVIFPVLCAAFGRLVSQASRLCRWRCSGACSLMWAVALAIRWTSFSLMALTIARRFVR